ncbi:hypothetical protein LCGC14_0704380 [marine sediment metagenome]|uniref:Uncharacterized protein n=1 Tax=marine sediment metagenome TaxID=412755 RepID=A0A0F9TPL1_9ZZZZ|nr:MAG: hypothetical protein Lokiarch_41500 [Candidatus Lokiarchaeum sp. GC14_75]
MEHIDLVELIASIIALIALINFPFIVKRRKDFVKYLPGIFFLAITFVAETIEEIFLHDLFEIIESSSLLLGAILLILAALMELDVISIKINFVRLNKKKELISK